MLCDFVFIDDAVEALTVAVERSRMCRAFSTLGPGLRPLCTLLPSGLRSSATLPSRPP